MGLLGTTTAEQYYNSSQKFTTTASQASGGASAGIYQLTVGSLPTAETDFIVYVDGTEINRASYSYVSPNITIDTSVQALAVSDVVLVEFIDRSLGDYRYINLVDIVTNFMYGYTGNGKVLNNVNKSDILFQAKRGIQEFAYDISRIEKIQEIDVPPSLTVPMPQDYVNYIRLSWIDTAGVEHPIFPARYTSRPSESIAQDADSEYLYDEDGGVLQVNPSITETRFTTKFNSNNIADGRNNDDYYLFSQYISGTYSRYGMNPETANYNGVFIVDEVNGKFGFDSSMSGRTLIIKYVSDGLAQDGEMKIHKLAEDAIYKYIYHGILSTKLNIPEYQIIRAKKERRAAMRNAKLRLSSIKLHELTNVMRGKSKRIKS